MSSSSGTTEYRNHLAAESSPYLLQHASNPVEWYAWGEEALAKARAEDKLILLSIGYSACHWCHVMAHESFEDEQTAALMNKRYVNIKVDREERPDLDKIYQLAYQALMRRAGGWPLTVMLTPEDHLPVFAGTYFPPQPRYNMPSFTDVLTRVADFYQQRRDEVLQQNASFRDFLRQLDATEQSHQGQIHATLLDQSRQQLEKQYDGLYGGFGEAPKFPHPTNIERLLRHWHATRAADTPDYQALEMALTSLKTMALGGIYDQLGGGFCRYSVDQEWMIPHFEKMLYDNGPLLTLYTDAALIERDASDQKLFRRIALEVGDWVMREMQSDSGGYFSSLDADTEGEEGRYYVWQTDQVRLLLENDQYDLFAARFGLDKPANFEGAWHLHVYESIDALAKRFQLSVGDVEANLDLARACLFRERSMRMAPGRDEKVLTAWNGLMIKGMAAAGRKLNRPDFVRSAQQAADFIRTHMREGNRLFASYKDGKARHQAYLDDYAFLLDGLLELLQAQWRNEDYHFARSLADDLLRYFEDKQRGGFFFTADDHEPLIQRPKPYSDEAIPSGNGIAAHALQRLGHLAAEAGYLDAAERCLRAAWTVMSQTPYAHNALLLALEEYVYPTELVILRGEPKALEQWQQAQYRPRRFQLAIANQIEDLAEELERYSSATTTLAYVCSGQQCQAPISDLESFKAL